MIPVKKKFLWVLVPALAATFSLQAQNCKFDEEKKDPFSNEMMRKTAHKIGPITWNWLMTFTQTGKQLDMGLQVVLQAHLQEPLAAGSILFLKFESGEMIQLPSLEETAPVHLVSNNVIWTNYIVKYRLNDEARARMAASPITDLKIKVGPQDILLPKITKKQTEKIMTTVRCMSE